MISPNCPIIMDATSTTSSYNTIERDAHSEQMRSNAGSSMDGLTENELLEEPNHDPEDEDTLSDDSLRLRLSDDEADVDQSRPTDQPTAPCFSSEQTTSQDTAIGLTDSGENVPLANEIESSMYKSGHPGSNKEIERSKHCDQISSETHVSSKKNTSTMWRGGNRKQSSSNNTVQPTKRSSHNSSFHVRHNHSHSNIHKSPSYFNNHDNFGRPPAYRRHGSNWRHSKGKFVHGSTRNMQRNVVREQVSNPKFEFRSKSDGETEFPRLSQSSVCPSNLIRQASSNTVDIDRDTTSPEAVKQWPTCERSGKKMAIVVKRNKDSLPSVNDELAKECRHLNLDKESTSGNESLAKLSSCSYDSKFASDDWFDEPHVTRNKYMQSTENSPPLLIQNSSKSEDVQSAMPINGTDPALATARKDDIAINDDQSPKNPNLDSLDPTTVIPDSDKDSKLIDVKVTSNIEVDVTRGIQTEVNPIGLVHEEGAEKLKEVVDSSVSLRVYEPEVTLNGLCTEVDHLDDIEITKQQVNDRDEAEEANVKKLLDDDSKNQKPHCTDNVENKFETECNEADIALSDEKVVTEQPMEIVAESRDAKEGEKSCMADIKSEIDPQLHNKPSLMADRGPQKTKLSKNIEENEKDRLVSTKTGGQSGDDSERNSVETNTSEPANNLERKPPPILKRSLSDTGSVADKLIHKKLKITSDLENGVCLKPRESEIKPGSPSGEKKSIAIEDSKETPKSLLYIRKFFQRDMKGKLAKLKREELEELIIQKLVETITMRSEIGRLREQARISERNQEATRVRCQQLSKQIKDFDMVLSRNAVDRRSNNDKPVPPIKINRSVGLQVNVMTDHGIQSLRALSTNNVAKPNVVNPAIVNGGNTKTVSEKIGHSTAVPRRGIKVRSPRRIEIPKNSSLPVKPQASTATPAALVVSKPADTSHNSSIPNNSKEQALQNLNLAQSAAVKVQNIIINGKIPHQVNRQVGVPNNQRPGSNDLIDLTEEEDKNRSANSSTSGVLPMVGTVTSPIATKVPHPRFQRVVQATIPGNVSIPTQPANIRVVQSVAQPTPTALVNNINTTRLTYVTMPGTTGTGRQLLIAPNPNQIRPATSTARGSFSNMTYKSGISTLANGNVRVITTAAPTIPNSQPPPAPLPDTPHYPAKNGWKLPPPPPSLKISKVTQGIVLSWNMAQSETYADIASYQLYAYQEIPGTPPNSNLWKKVGDVRALPLPMACTLKEFTPGNNYHFAVRAVDTHSRLGQYSIPRNISL